MIERNFAGGFALTPPTEHSTVDSTTLTWPRQTAWALNLYPSAPSASSDLTVLPRQPSSQQPKDLGLRLQGVGAQDVGHRVEDLSARTFAQSYRSGIRSLVLGARVR